VALAVTVAVRLAPALPRAAGRCCHWHWQWQWQTGSEAASGTAERRGPTGPLAEGAVTPSRSTGGRGYPAREGGVPRRGGGVRASSGRASLQPVPLQWPLAAAARRRLRHLPLAVSLRLAASLDRGLPRPPRDDLSLKVVVEVWHWGKNRPDIDTENCRSYTSKTCPPRAFVRGPGRTPSSFGAPPPQCRPS
jgi:hypothetical protein